MKTFADFLEQKDENITETFKLIGTHEKDNKKAKVYHDRINSEYRVKHFTNDRHEKESDYFTDDLKDAHDTAKVWLGRK